VAGMRSFQQGQAGPFICVTPKVPSHAPGLQSPSSPANNEGSVPSYSGGKGLLVSCDSDMLVIPACRVTDKTVVDINARSAVFSW
jgi:hypothetical protein